MSAHVEPWGSENTTPPAFFVEKSSEIMCWMNEIAPLASLFCSNQASPNTCACSDVTTSLSPSPLTSYTHISAPPGAPRPFERPNACGWYFHIGVSALPG